MKPILTLIYYKYIEIIITFEERILRSKKFCIEAIHVSVAAVFKEIAIRCPEQRERQ